MKLGMKTREFVICKARRSSAFVMLEDKESMGIGLFAMKGGHVC